MKPYAYVFNTEGQLVYTAFTHDDLTLKNIPYGSYFFYVADGDWMERRSQQYIPKNEASIWEIPTDQVPAPVRAAAMLLS